MTARSASRVAGARRVLVTASYLRPVQILDRLVRPLRRRWAGGVRASIGATLAGAEPVRPVALPTERIEGAAAEIHGVRIQLDGSDRWSPASASRLWVYRLHCFRWIHEIPAGEAARWIGDWIDANPLAAGPGWEPYCLSMRVREWLEWLLANPTTPERARILRSAVLQMEALERQIEFHLLGNHLLENAVTLCWGGLRIRHPQRHAWLRRGLALLRTSLREQVLPDGAHAERSPMYQAAVAEGLLRLARVAAQGRESGARSVQRLADNAGTRLLSTLPALTHADGEYALLNDAALGGAPGLLDLTSQYAPGRGTGSLPRGVLALPDAGFLAWRGGEGAHVVFDVGPIGPRHQPGHGHAGALAFELCHARRRIVTDTGVYTYTVGKEREYDRSTAAHSTVELDSGDQSDVWAAFRCGRRIRPMRPRWRGDHRGAEMCGGYRSHTGSVCHARRLRVSPTRLEVTDDIVSRKRSREVVSRLHLAPGIETVERDGRLLLRDGVEVLASVHAADRVAVEDTAYHPSFGVETERRCLVVRRTVRGRLRLRWRLNFEFASR